MAQATILIVEDENIVALDIQSRVEGLGYTVAAMARSGEQAIEKVAETHPDLVLMDIQLKGALDGVQSAEHIRARFDIPVVYVTAYIVTDHQGKIKFMNPVAAALTGWNSHEAAGMDAGQVFDILRAGTRAAVDSPITRVLLEGAAVNLPDGILVATGHGREIPIDCSAAPVWDEKGKITDVVLVLRDITERKREEAFHRYAVALEGWKKTILPCQTTRD